MKKHLKLCVISSIFFALLVYLIWGNTALTVSNIKISSSRIPIAFSGFRIAQVSDLHNAEFGKGNRKLLELLSESKPDIIAITGDLVDAGHTDIGVALDFAKEAVKIAPVYYVTGNHEASLSQYDELKIELKTIGVIVLEDEAVQLKHDTEEITLIGLSDPDFTIKGDIFGEVPAMVSTKLNNLADDENSYPHIFVLFLFITERGFSCLKHGTARRKKPLKEGRIRLTILLKFWASEELPHISL